MTSSLRRFLRTQQFNPGFAGPFVSPFYLARRGLWRAISAASHHLGGSLLDVGCGSRPYRSLFKVERYVGMDIDSEPVRRSGQADVLYDGHQFPFTDGEFQSVLDRGFFTGETLTFYSDNLYQRASRFRRIDHSE